MLQGGFKNLLRVLLASSTLFDFFLHFLKNLNLHAVGEFHL